MRSADKVTVSGVGRRSAHWMAVGLLALTIGARTALAEHGLPDVTDLPLVELPAKKPTIDPVIDDASGLLVFISSGDGGWANLDRQIGENLQSRGISVIGLDTGAYFREPHTPAASSADLERIVEHYLRVWDKQAVVLIGYSRGADDLPFMVNHLPATVRDRLELIVLLGVAKRTNFKFLATDKTSDSGNDGALTSPEIDKLQGLPLVCIYGSKETDTACPTLPTGLAREIRLPGGHHFHGDYTGIANRILVEIKARQKTPDK